MADDELKALLVKLLTKVDGLATKEDVAAVEARLSAKIETEARVVAARLDEQGRVLVAMIPTHIAAVPPRSATG